MEELKRIVEEIQKAFAEFKKLNDEQISEIKKKGSADPLLAAQVEKLNARITELEGQKSALEKEMGARIDEVEAKANRRPTGAGENFNPAKKQHSEAFGKWLRKGIEAGLSDLECKAMNVTTPADGGFAVPEELDREIIRLARDENVMRQICRVITVGTSEYKKLAKTRGAASGWVGETDARPATNAPQLAEITPFWGEVYANPEATQQMLDDAFYSVEADLAADIAFEISDQEESAFISGTGIKKPKGFLAYPNAATADSARAFGTLEYMKTGVDGAFLAYAAGTASPADNLQDLVGKLRASYRAGALWLMNRNTATTVRKMKDGQSNYIWQPSIQAGQPSTLLGYTIREAENMPDIASNSLSIAFGNFMRGYIIADRAYGIRMLRDPFTNKPYVGFYTTKRVGGMVADSNAIKLLKFAA